MTHDTIPSQPETIPIVDLAPFLEGTPAGKQAVGAAIRQAAESVGFMVISGHGVDPAVVDAVFKASQRFHQLPEQERLKIKVNPSHRGFIPMNNSKINGTAKPSMNESFLAGLDLGPDDPDVQAGTPLHGPNQWPSGLPGFREDVEAYQKAMNELGHQVLRAFAVALGLDEEFFMPFFAKPMPFV
ncbi:MAG: 2OG-Fe(II) oxygenase, partial [Rhizobacter sp.]|nr:2OG-Fe(II) oxygenase [Rhizobacter sp.]